MPHFCFFYSAISSQGTKSFTLSTLKPSGSERIPITTDINFAEGGPSVYLWSAVMHRLITSLDTICLLMDQGASRTLPIVVHIMGCRAETMGGRARSMPRVPMFERTMCPKAFPFSLKADMVMPHY